MTIWRDTKVIAEAWDAAGLYQIGRFPGDRWVEWNGRYRDDIRRFVKGEPGMVGAVAARMAGSADLYQANGELPTSSINFVTCHDGFTLNDLVSYDQKHNAANGEGRPGRTQRQPELELRRGGRIERSRRGSASQPSGTQLRRDPHALPRRADAARGRRGAAHPAGQQQRLLPGQPDQLVRLDAGREAPRRPPLLQEHDRIPQAARRVAARVVLRRQPERPRSRGRDLARDEAGKSRLVRSARAGAGA